MTLRRELLCNALSRYCDLGIARSVKAALDCRMTLRDKAQETMAEAAEVRRATDEAFLKAMRTELTVVNTMCLLAEQEHGEKRAHHIQLAEQAFASALTIANRVEPNQQDRDAIEESRHNIRRHGGRDFSQPQNITAC